MRAIVCANSALGIACLATLLDLGADVAAVLTHPDDPHERAWFGSVAEQAVARGLPVFTDERLDTPEWLARLRGWRADFLFSFYYRRLLPPAVLAMASRGALNLHGSMLPRYRGRAPTNWALIYGERETGVTLHHMVERADAGDIVAQRRVPIADDDTALTLYRKQVAAAAALLREVYPRLCDGTAPRRPMHLAAGFYCGRRTAADGRLDWRRGARTLYDLVRAVTHPYPGAFALWGETPLRIWWAEVVQDATSAGAPGTVAAIDDGVVVETGEGRLRLLRVQAADDEERPAAEWARRAAITAGTVLT